MRVKTSKEMIRDEGFLSHWSAFACGTFNRRSSLCEGGHSGLFAYRRRGDGVGAQSPSYRPDFGKILKEMSIPSNERAPLDLPILSGGPMDTGRGFLLHTLDFEEPDTLKVLDRFGVTGTLEALRDVATGKGPQDLLFILGYSGWGAGQLEQELQENAWLVASADHDLIFFYPDRGQVGPRFCAFGG
jgi:hypothetical protein